MKRRSSLPVDCSHAHGRVEQQSVEQCGHSLLTPMTMREQQVEGGVSCVGASEEAGEGVGGDQVQTGGKAQGRRVGELGKKRLPVHRHLREIHSLWLYSKQLPLL